MGTAIIMTTELIRLQWKPEENRMTGGEKNTVNLVFYTSQPSILSNKNILKNECKIKKISGKDERICHHQTFCARDIKRYRSHLREMILYGSPYLLKGMRNNPKNSFF